MVEGSGRELMVEASGRELGVEGSGRDLVAEANGRELMVKASGWQGSQPVEKQGQLFERLAMPLEWSRGHPATLPEF